MKKICILYLGRRGAGPVDSYEMCKQFLCKNHEIVAYISRYVENVESFRKLERDYSNFRLVEVNTYNNKLQFLLRTMNLLKFKRIAKKIEIGHFDFIYIPMITLWAGIITFFIHKTVINAAIHDPESHLGEHDIIIEKIFDMCANKAQYLTVFSKKFIPVVAEKFNKNSKDICLLRLSGYNFYGTENIDPMSKPSHRILFFGRIVEYKGLKYLLEAGKEILKVIPDFKIRIVGNGTLTFEEESLIKDLGSSIELTNRWIKDDEVKFFFKDVDFIVLPYVEATQSGIVLLSYAMGKGILSTNVGAIDEQVLSDTGILVPSKNIGALVEGIQEMYKNDNFIAFGRRGFELVTTEWTFPVQAQKLLDFMDGIRND